MILIQASPVAWDGSPDKCMNPVDGYKTAIHKVVAKCREAFPDSPVTLIAPDFAKKFDFQDAFSDLPFLKIFYGSDDSPLERMVNATNSLDGENLIIRVDGQHPFWHVATVKRLFEFAQEKGLDCCKLPDNFPVSLGADVYRVHALRNLYARIKDDPDMKSYCVHPKYAMFFSDDYKTDYLPSLPEISDEYLRECRKSAITLYNEDIIRVNMDKAILHGAQLPFHYTWALSWLPEGGRYLDVACGLGYGTEILSHKCGSVIGVDMNEETIQYNKQNNNNPKISFQTGDITNLDFPDAYFDSITSFETMEHVDPHKALLELRRVLKSDGKLIISTPQNALGHIPLNVHHFHEYGIDELISIVSQYFHIEIITALKQGCIYRDGDKYGQNTLMALKKI